MTTVAELIPGDVIDGPLGIGIKEDDQKPGEQEP